MYAATFRLIQAYDHARDNDGHYKTMPSSSFASDSSTAMSTSLIPDGGCHIRLRVSPFLTRDSHGGIVAARRKEPTRRHRIPRHGIDCIPMARKDFHRTGRIGLPDVNVAIYSQLCHRSRPTLASAHDEAIFGCAETAADEEAMLDVARVLPQEPQVRLEIPQLHFLSY